VVPPDSHKVPRVPWYLGTRRGRYVIFCVRDCYPLWSNFPERSTRCVLCNFPAREQSDHVVPRDPTHATPVRLHMNGLGCSAFARRYLRNRGCFLFLQVLRWFTSLGSLPKAYVFSQRMTGHDPSRVSPFGHLRVKACLAAHRRLS
jgi:hypothetical protein